MAYIFPAQKSATVGARNVGYYVLSGGHGLGDWLALFNICSMVIKMMMGSDLHCCVKICSPVCSLKFSRDYFIRLSEVCATFTANDYLTTI